jgi:hypothetical protein
MVRGHQPGEAVFKSILPERYRLEAVPGISTGGPTGPVSVCNLSWTAGFVFLAVTSKSQFIVKAHGPTYSGERRNAISELESSMNPVRVEQKSYQMPPQDGITVAHFLTVTDIERSLRFYETVFGSRILSRGDSKGAPGYSRLRTRGSLSTSGAARHPTNHR